MGQCIFMLTLRSTGRELGSRNRHVSTIFPVMNLTAVGEHMASQDSSRRLSAWKSFAVFNFACAVDHISFTKRTVRSSSFERLSPGCRKPGGGDISSNQQTCASTRPDRPHLRSSTPTEPPASAGAWRGVTLGASCYSQLIYGFQRLGYVLLLYDHLLTLQDEVKLIWPGPWSLVKTLFLMWVHWARFNYQILNQPPCSCRRWVPVEGYAEVTSLGISNLHAIYGRSRRVLVFLLILYILTYMSILTTATLALVQMIPQLSYSQLAGICTVSEKPVTLQAVWAAPCRYFGPCIETDSYTSFFIWALITLLISRLLLNLRNVSNHTQWSAETDVKGLSIMQFAPRSDLDDVPKSKAPVSSTGFTNSTRLTDVMEWEEEEEEEDKEGPDFDPEERRASKRRQEQDVEIASPDEDMEMGPIRRGITRHFIVNEGGSDQGA
ncbi:hypothetical protein AG1IA_06053 [Rhizoctonia solani AG-1 IA]|uniref:DUF6533 domain-containing protein n=2 Tax=Rhizoctonia solani TaxID=456999 RepID=L8WT49_THACA|nr:hypothetical protein AG1IA_06053 [Rhizoctonia solani AG-1 IA]